MSSAVPWPILAVRNGSLVTVLLLAERVQSSRPVLAATIERARQGNIANVPDMPFSLSP